MNDTRTQARQLLDNKITSMVGIDMDCLPDSAYFCSLVDDLESVLRDYAKGLMTAEQRDSNIAAILSDCTEDSILEDLYG